MTLRSLIKQYRDEHDMSQRQFATLCGLSNGYISMIEKNTNPNTGQPLTPSIPALNKIAAVLGYTLDELLTIADDMPVTLSSSISLPKADNFQPVSLQKTVRRINVLGSVPAGIPTEAVEDIIDWEELPEEMFAGGKEYFGLRVSGDSMWPDILDGDIVIIRKTPTCDSGSIAVVYVNGYDATLKQVKIAEDGSITLQPRNPNYPPRTYSPQEVEELPVSIAGVVVELRRKWGL